MCACVVSIRREAKMAERALLIGLLRVCFDKTRYREEWSDVDLDYIKSNLRHAIECSGLSKAAQCGVRLIVKELSQFNGYDSGGATGFIAKINELLLKEGTDAYSVSVIAKNPSNSVSLTRDFPRPECEMNGGFFLSTAHRSKVSFSEYTLFQPISLHCVRK